MDDPLFTKVQFTNSVVSKIKDTSIQNFLIACLDDFPNYFWIAPSSGSGKYHPADERGYGGLVLHTKRVVKLVEDLSVMYELSYYEQDVLITAAVLHDSWCKGLDPDTTHYSTDLYHSLYPLQQFPYKCWGDRFIPERVWDDIMSCVVAHMGKWSITRWVDVDKKLPNVLKLADYIASRSHITVNV